jgi:hypothetical protein
MSVRHNWYIDNTTDDTDGEVWDSTTVDWDSLTAVWDSASGDTGPWYQSNYTEWKDLIDWTHCWDAEDDGIVFYNATNNSDFPAISGRRISLIPDRGLGTVPLVKDAGYWGQGLFSLSNDSPGPILHRNDKRFNGRRCFHNGVSYRTGQELYGTAGLSTTPASGSGYWFNDGVGYGHGFFVASLGRVTRNNSNTAANIMDSQLEGNVTLGKYISDVTKYGVTTGLGELWPSTGVTIDRDQTILFMVYCNTTTSWSRIVRRNSEGQILDTKTSMTLTENSAEK